MRKKENKEVEETLYNKLLKLSDDVAEEFDMLELIEDEIKDLFSCDLNCVTCSREEQGKCMQNFKKGNLYWLRKIVQDEKFLKEIVGQMEDMKDTIIELADALKISLQMVKSKAEDKKKVENNNEDNSKYTYFT